jgi:hypothetical protein
LGNDESGRREWWCTFEGVGLGAMKVVDEENRLSMWIDFIFRGVKSKAWVFEYYRVTLSLVLLVAPIPYDYPLTNHFLGAEDNKGSMRTL